VHYCYIGMTRSSPAQSSMPIQLQILQNSVVCPLLSVSQTHAIFGCYLISRNNTRSIPQDIPGILFDQFCSFLFFRRHYRFFLVSRLFLCSLLMLFTPGKQWVSVPTGTSVKSTIFGWNCLQLLKSMGSSPSCDATMGRPLL
jgi:hypothetical protein